MNNLTPLPKRRALRCCAAATKIDSSFWENDSLPQSAPASPDLSAFPFLILIPLSTRLPPHRILSIFPFKWSVVLFDFLVSVLDPLKRFANRFIIKRAVRRHQTAVLCIDIYAIYKCLLQGIFRLSDRHYLPATSNKNIQKLGNVCFAWLHFKTNITFTLNSTLFSPQKKLPQPLSLFL